MPIRLTPTDTSCSIRVMGQVAPEESEMLELTKTEIEALCSAGPARMAELTKAIARERSPEWLSRAQEA